MIGNNPHFLFVIREHSSITSVQWRGVGGLTENADAADASSGDGGVTGQN